MELALTETPGMQIERPGKRAMKLLPQQEPKPPLVRKVNIVVKFLDSAKFPTLTKYTYQMIRDLEKDRILNDVIGRDIIGVVREFRYNEKSGRMELTGSIIDIGDIVPKESYIYAMILPNNHYLMLRHIVGIWFRCLGYFSNHDSYTQFLNIFFTNKMSHNNP